MQTQSTTDWVCFCEGVMCDIYFSKLKICLLIVVAFIGFFVFYAATSINAYALETSKCTAMPNVDNANEVMGATETRITWEGQIKSGEDVKELTLVLPDDTTFDADDTRVTVLSGEDNMDREKPEFTTQTNGTTINLILDKPATGESLLRVNICGVFFPAHGGQLQLRGTALSSKGKSSEITNIPSIKVEKIKTTERIANWLDSTSFVKKWNSVRILHLFLDPGLIVTSFPQVFKGFLMALALVAVAFPLAIPWGFVLSLMRMSRFRILRGIATLYVNVVRGTPLFLQIYIAFFGLPLAGIDPPDYVMGFIVLALNSGAYLCEIFRAGIQSIPKGQFEASRSLGMTGAQTMLHVIVPQTVRRVMPTMTSEFILLYKDTSLLASIGIMEVVMYAKTIVAATGSITPYIVAALFYLVITLPLARFVGKLERKLALLDGGHVVETNNKKKRKSRAFRTAKDGEVTLVSCEATSFVPDDQDEKGEK